MFQWQHIHIGTVRGGVFESSIKATQRGPVGLETKAAEEELNTEALGRALVITGHYHANKYVKP
jgi:hypothetical protein